MRGKRSRAQYQEPGTDSDFLESDFDMSEESKEEETKERPGKSSKGLQKRRLVSQAKGQDDSEETKEVTTSKPKQKAEAKMNMKISATLD